MQYSIEGRRPVIPSGEEAPLSKEKDIKKAKCWLRFFLFLGEGYKIVISMVTGLVPVFAKLR